MTPVRAAVARAIPRHLRTATAAGIGVFLTFIGLKNAGVVAADPVTFVRLGLLDYPALLTVLGLAVTVLLLKRKSPFAFLSGIFLVTLIAWAARLGDALGQATGEATLGTHGHEGMIVKRRRVSATSSSFGSGA